VDPDAVEQRVLGCLLEKQRTTPDQYPLTLNALRLACNQATNRDPVVDYDEETIRGAVARLRRRDWIRFASGQGSRAAKYRHLLDEALRIDSAEQAVLTVMLLRGAQTPGELKGRTERLHPFATLADVEETVDRLIERGYAERDARRPGQKEDRFGHLLGDRTEGTDTTVRPTEGTDTTVRRTEGTDTTVRPALEERVARLEREVAELRAQLLPSGD
jgi:uncharacterized protein YceH (UPF0502 family)